MSTRYADNLLWLCSIPSPTGSEGPICDALAEFIPRHARTPIELARIGNSLVVKLGPPRNGPSVCLVGHTAVVPTQHARTPYVEGDRLYGPGASDMKSGLALMLGLIEQPCATDCTLTLVFYAGEEGPFDGNELGRVFAERSDLRSMHVAIALEPTDNELQLGCGGSIQARVEFMGKSAHSSRPWQGDNAIYKAIDPLIRLKALQPTPREIQGLTWTTSFSATLIEGGRAPNVIPDRVILNINARFAPDQSAKEIEQTIERLVGPEAQVSLVDHSPPAPPCRDHPLIRALEECGVRGVRPKLAWTDVARFAQVGVPAANFGPGTLSQAHQRNEWTSLSDLEAGDVVLRRWLARIGTARSAA